MIPQTFTVTSSIGCFYFLVFLFYNFQLSSPCGRLSRLMLAFERTLKQHLISYRIVIIKRRYYPRSHRLHVNVKGFNDLLRFLIHHWINCSFYIYICCFIAKFQHCVILSFQKILNYFSIFQIAALHHIGSSTIEKLTSHGVRRANVCNLGGRHCSDRQYSSMALSHLPDYLIINF